MVSVNQDHAIPGQHLLQHGIRLGYLTVESGVPGEGFVCCAAGMEKEDSSIIDFFSSNDRGEVIFGL